MKAKDVQLMPLGAECPEQYAAYDPDGKQIGYIRVRWGHCVAWCPDERSDNEVYASELKSGWWKFGSNQERKRHLRRIKAAIAAWVNQQTI